MIQGRNDFLQEKLNNLRHQVRQSRVSQNIQRSFTPNISNTKYQFTHSEVLIQPYSQNSIGFENKQQNIFQNNYTSNIWQQKVEPKIVYAKNGITSLYLKNNKKNGFTQLPLNNTNKRQLERVSQINKFQPTNQYTSYQKRNFAKSVDFQTSRMLQNEYRFNNLKDFSRRSDLSPDRKAQVHNQLCQQHEIMVESNIRLQKDIDNLQGRVQRGNEELKYSDLEFLKELQYQEDQFKLTQDKFAEFQEKLTQIEFQIQREKNRQKEFQNVLPDCVQENKLLKQEVSKYADIAGNDILDMENNLNKLGRLKKMQKESYLMEKQKRQNDIEFQEENYKNMIKQKQEEKQQQIEKITYEKNKLEKSIYKIQEDLKNFNYDANQRIQNEMTEVMDEEEAKQKLQYDNYIQQIQAEDEQCQIIKNLNDQMNQELQNNSKKNNSYQIQYKNKRIYLTEEMNNLHHLLEKMHLELNNQETKQESDLVYLEELKQQNEEIQQKTESLNNNFEQQIIQFSQEHDQEINELKMQVKEFEQIQHELQQQIYNQKGLIDQDNQKMNNIVEDQYNKIKNTLSDQLNCIFYRVKMFNCCNYKMCQNQKYTNKKYYIKNCCCNLIFIMFFQFFIKTLSKIQFV